MRFRQHLFQWLILLLVLSLVLVACERPIPGGDETSDETPTETDTGATVEEGETVETGETAEEPDVSAETSEAGEAEDTPRVDTEEAEEVAGEAEAPEESEAVNVEAAEAGESAEQPEVEETPAEAESDQEAAAVDEDETSTPVTHTVAAGENLYRIGLKYGISWVTLAEFNDLENANDIKVGQVLNIPGEAEPKVEPTPSPQTESTYTVKADDNLYKIGLAYGISWVQIAEANGLVNPNQIIVGQVLKIPVDTPGPKPQFTHQVKAGETLFLISLQYGVPWPTIAEENDIDSPYVIYTGQALVIPGEAD